MVKVLVIANASNRARVFIPVADMLVVMGHKATFISLDSILDSGASQSLKGSKHPFIEFPYKGKKLFDMNKSERFRCLVSIKPAIRDLLQKFSPDIILLGAAAYVEGVFIEQARNLRIKTILMQDGLRIDVESSLLSRTRSLITNRLCALLNEWTLASKGVNYFFTPFGTNRVDGLFLFGSGLLEKLARQGIMREKLFAIGNPLYDSVAPLPKPRIDDIQQFFGLPPKRPVILFGMQCFHRHMVLTLEEEIDVVRDIVEFFSDQPDYTLIIKLHPDNDYDLYREKFEEWNPPDNICVVKNEFTPHELLTIATVFMTVYSTMALEALVYNVPVITLDYTPVKYHVILEPAAFSAKSKNDLEKLMVNDEWIDQLKLRIKTHRDTVLERELVNLGFAAEKAAEAIVKIANK
jgi:hypothetical protein